MEHIKRLKDILTKKKYFNGWYLRFVVNRTCIEPRYQFGSWFFPNINSVFEFIKPIVDGLINKNINFKIFKSMRINGEGSEGIWLLFNNKKDVPEGFPIEPISIPGQFYKLTWENQEMSISKFESYYNSKKYKEYLLNKNINKYNL